MMKVQVGNALIVRRFEDGQLWAWFGGVMVFLIRPTTGTHFKHDSIGEIVDEAYCLKRDEKSVEQFISYQAAIRRLAEKGKKVLLTQETDDLTQETDDEP